MNHFDDSRFPSRKSPRLKQFDYSTPNCYFLTICTWNKQCLFGNPGYLNTYGKAAEDGLLEIERHFSNAKLDKYVVMPNHVHMILSLHGSGSGVPTIIGLYKSYVSKRIHAITSEVRVWQSSYHDHVIRNQYSYDQIWLYIDANPANWEKDCFYFE